MVRVNLRVKIETHGFQLVQHRNGDQNEDILVANWKAVVAIAANLAQGWNPSLRYRPV